MVATKDKYERWYRRRLHNYMVEHYEELEDNNEIEWWNDPAPNQWLFDIPEQRVRVELTCNKKGIVTEQRYDLTGRDMR